MSKSKDQLNLSINEAFDLVSQTLIACNTSPDNADCVSNALVNAEIDGQNGHGLSRVPSYAGGAKSGKINGHAIPELKMITNSMLMVDAKLGFAYPAFELAIEKAVEVTRESGIAFSIIKNSHHFGVAGAHCENLAEKGLAAFVFGNSPKAIAPWGGKQALLGTNPIAFAAPIPGRSPLVIDLALSKVARGKVMSAQKSGKSIPEGWALDSEGKPTTDSEKAMAGTMIPIGEAKGYALALMVEVMSAAISGASLAFEATSLFTPNGPSPNLGQTIISIDVDRASEGAFSHRILDLVNAIENEIGTRLPGASRLSNREIAKTNGLFVPNVLYQEIVALSDSNTNNSKL